jgi:peptidoglycan/LPS O-acetylase OafA/YrhL
VNIFSNNQLIGNENRFRSLDFLRGLAILGVIAIHVSLGLPTQIRFIDQTLSFGLYGVQLFYLISAITMCLMWEQRADEKSPTKNFYIRRFLRIAPLFWLAIPIYLSVNGFEPSYWAPEGIGATQIILTILFLQGFWPDAINSVVPGGWSIAVEMTFYFIFPVLIRTFQNRANLYLYCAIFLWLVNNLFFKGWITEFFTSHYPAMGALIIKDYLSLYFLNQAPIFLIGCWIYFSGGKHPTKFNLIIFGAWIGFAAVLKFFMGINGLGFLLVYLTLTALVIFCIAKKVHCKPIEALGKNSYAMYLIHFLVISFVYRLLPEKTGLMMWFMAMSLTVMFSYVLSRIVYFLIESRIQLLANKLTEGR